MKRKKRRLKETLNRVRLEGHEAMQALKNKATKDQRDKQQKNQLPLRELV